MVDRILAAGVKVISERGYEGATTNRIADEAGISPGSLYQYFPNKDAIVAAVAEMYAEDLSARMVAQMRENMRSEPELLVPTVLHALVSTLAESRGVVHAMVDQVPGRKGAMMIAQLESRVSDLTQGYLLSRRDRLGDTDLVAASWILVKTATQLAIRYVLDEPPIAQATFVTELSNLVLGYPNSGTLSARPTGAHDNVGTQKIE